MGVGVDLRQVVHITTMYIKQSFGQYLIFSNINLYVTYPYYFDNFLGLVEEMAAPQYGYYSAPTNQPFNCTAFIWTINVISKMCNYDKYILLQSWEPFSYASKLLSALL